MGLNGSILLGSLNERKLYDSIICINVISALDKLQRNIANRQYIFSFLNYDWRDSFKIEQARNKFCGKTILNGELVMPLFYSYRECIDLCVDIYWRGWNR